MSTVDNRIVNMQFNNKEFESRIQTTLKSLANLKSSLKLDESAKSLENLEQAGKKFSLDGIGRGVEAISGKFSALGIIGVTALANITNSAINAGKQIVSALTIDPIKMGFQEYETQINAVQTILANTSSKGTTLTDVNAALDELNAYADRTIYNFTEMTRNIGTFTAAGVDLDTSVQAIKGIANLAAVSGSTSQQASTAMYQLSQALASGTVKLMDWNSVVNAGMGGQVFQDALKETARVHGVNIDQMIKNEGSFRETLKDGWLTSEILTETLSKFTGDLNEEQLKTMGYTKDQIKSIMEMGQMANDAATKVKTFTQLFDTLKEAAQSGWTQSWEIIVGDFEEAKELLTEVSDVFGGIIGASADARNEMLKGWKDLGGRSALIESVRNAFHGILDVIAPIKEAFRDIFPPMTGQQLFNITEGLKKLTEQFKIGETTAANIKSTFKGFFALIDIGVMAIKALGKGVFDLVGAILPVGDGLLGITGGIGDFIVGIRDAIKAGDIFNKVIGGISAVLTVAIGWVEGFVKAISSSFAKIDLSGLNAFADTIHERFSPLEALGNALKWVFDGLVGIVQKAIPIAAGFASMVGQAFSGLSDAITEAFTGGDFSKVLDIFNTGLFAGLLLGLRKFVNSLSNITENAGGFLEGITGILDGVKGSLEAYQSTLKAKTLITIAGAIAILAASLTVLSMIDSDKLTMSLGAMTTMFIELFGALAVLDKIMSSKGFKGMGKIAVGMIALSTSVLILSAALKNMADMDFGDLLVGLGGIAGMAVVLVKSAEALSKTHGKLIKGSMGLIAFATSILILTKAVQSLSTLNLAELAKGLVGVGVLCGELVLFLKYANLDKMGVLKGAGLMLLAGAINVLASAVSKISQMNWGKMIQGLVGVGALLAGLSVFSNSLKNTKGVISAAVAATILGGAMHILAGAVEKLGGMPFEVIKQGLIGMGAALVGIIVTMNLLPKDMMGKSVGMVALAGAMVILSKALSAMGSLTEQQFITGLAAMAGSLAILVVAMKFMTTGLAGAAALLVISNALLILSGALKIMGSMSWGEYAVSMVTLVSALAILGGASALLAPLTPVMLALAGAFALFGVATAAIGVGVLALSAGLAALAVSGTAGAAALVVVVTSIIGLVPMLIQKIGEGIIAFADVLIQGAPKIFEAGKVLLLGFVNALIETIPAAVAGILTLLTSLLRAIADNMPEYIQAGFDILLAFLKGIRDNIGEVVDVAIDIVINFLDALGKKWVDVVDAGFELIIDFIDGLGKSIKENMPRLVESIIGLGEAVIEGLVDSLFAGVNKVKQSIANVGNKLVEGFKETLGITPEGCKKFKDMAGDIISGLINGFKEKIANIKDAAAELGENIVNAVKNKLGIQSPSKVMRDEVGRWIVVGLAEGIKKDTSAEEAAEQKAKNIVNAFKRELDKFDLDSSTADLEYQLWEAVKGDDATLKEKAAMEAETLAKKVMIQAKKVETAQGEYTVTVQKLGSQSEAAQEAYNKYLKSQIELVTMSKELEELQDAQLKQQQDASRKYYNYLAANKDLIGVAGLTYEDLAKNATAMTGFDPKQMGKDMSIDVKTAVTEAMATVQTVYSENAETTFGSLVNNYSNWGAEYATTMSNAIRDKAPLVTNATTTMMNDCISKLKEYVDDWHGVGSNLVDGLIAGIEENIARAKEAAAELASMTLSAAKTEMGVHSPSVEFEKIGRFADLGLAKGLTKYAYVASQAAASLGGVAIEGLKDSLKKIAEVAMTDMDMNPTIRPVIDLSNIKAGEKELDSIFDKTHGISVNTSAYRASRISNSMNNNVDDTKINPQPAQGATYNFTQNNYSPKALSQIEIYRQTKNQFSVFKGVVSAK